MPANARRSKAPRAHWAARAVLGFGFLLLYVPLVTLVATSFQTVAPEGIPREWTLDWYRRALANERIVAALGMSLYVGAWTTLGATIIGTTAGLALQRSRFRAKPWLDGLTHLPLIMPEIVMGLSLLIWFVVLKITLGSFSVILAHITFSVSYVVITVRSRLEGFDDALEDAARDLGANAWQTFRRVTFPLIWPGVFSGALMAFTISFDDFLITFFTTGVGTDTLPLKIYSMIHFGVSPEINALSTLMLGVTFMLVLAFFRPGRS